MRGSTKEKEDGTYKRPDHITVEFLQKVKNEHFIE